MRQRTLRRAVSCTGIGLHGGAPVALTLRPAPPGSGVTFQRIDGPAPWEIAARPEAVRATRYATTLGEKTRSLRTVEHLLAALYGLGIDNARVDVDGPELPVMDGSAASFVYLLREAGLAVQAERRPVLRVRRRVGVREGARRITIEPARELRIDYAIDFDHPAIGRQELSLASLDAFTFEREVARARTFGFERDVDALRSAGFARGASLENTVVLGEREVLNPGGLRWPDEFVRHKVLDLVGDLSLLGAVICGHVRAERGGHSLHHALVERLLHTPGACDFEGLREAPALATARG